MLFSKVAVLAVCWKISWAAEDCAVHPREDMSMGQHAMLQHSAKSSKGDVLQLQPVPDILADGAEAPKGDVFTALDDKATVLKPQTSQLGGAVMTDPVESTKLNSNIEEKAVPTSEYQSGGVISDENNMISSESQTHGIVSDDEKAGFNFVSKSNSSGEACDWQCYIDRYPDLQELIGTQQLIGAENHYLSFGKMEGRDCTCAESEASETSETESLAVSPTQDAEEAATGSAGMSSSSFSSSQTEDAEEATIGSEEISSSSFSSSSSSSSSLSASAPTSLDVTPTQDAEEITPGSEQTSSSNFSPSSSYSPLSDMPVSDNAEAATDGQPTSLDSIVVPPVPGTGSEMMSSSSSSSLSATPVSTAVEATADSKLSSLPDSLATGAEEVVAGPVSQSSSFSSSSSGCDWQCYLNRYPDLQSTLGSDVDAAKEHFNSMGFAEGRVCTCDGVESPVVEGNAVESPVVADEAAKDAELESLRTQVLTLQAQTQNQGSMALTNRLSTCQPYAEGEKEALAAQMNEYVHSDDNKFQSKISETKGESHASAGHVAIMKYLRDKVLKKDMSILDVGCSAGGMLRFIKDEYDNGLGTHDSLVGVEQVMEWVQFAQEYFNEKGVAVYEGDITEYALPEPFASKTFDLVMLNDVMGYVPNTRYGCFFSQLDRVTHSGSVVYVHSPSPMSVVSETESHETVVPHHLLVAGMAMKGFELVAFEHDKDTVCGGEGEGIPRQLQGAHCYQNGWPKYVHTTFRKVDNQDVLNIK